MCVWGGGEGFVSSVCVCGGGVGGGEKGEKGLLALCVCGGGGGGEG